MEQLKLQLKEQIIDALNLEDMTPADIEDAAPLFGEGLGLDSIDALELIMILDKQYGIKFADKQASKAALASIDAMAAYVTEHRTK
ncbi:MAG: phosphopantetheine-binding protein [Paludibacteraceae bacterium]|nr:phosphopantetheine-binding protein [Paludibacteraceae bacterium]